MLTRRKTLTLAGSMALSALGCEASVPAPPPPSPPQPWSPPSRGKAGVVPDVTSYGSRFDEIIRDLDRFLAEKRGPFRAGYTADDGRSWPGGVQDLENPVRDVLANAPSRPLRTPILGSHRNLRRYFQLGGADVTHFSLIAGHGDRGHSVHNSWLRWLLDDDNCDLEVSGSTEFGSCQQLLGHRNCRIHLTVQDFRMLSGKPRRLIWSDPDASPAEINAHKGHADPFEDCKSFESKPTLTQCPVSSGS